MRTCLAFASFGVAVRIDISGAHRAGLVDALALFAPPGATPVDAGGPFAADLRVKESHGRFGVYDRGCLIGPGGPQGLWDAAYTVERAVRSAVALHAPGHVFVHAGVAAGPAGAVLIPGRSFTGKTTLVAALVAAGMSYLSDEYAVLSAEGTVAPYPRRLSFRTRSGRLDLPPDRFGATAPDRPHRVAAVVSTWFDPEATAPLVEGTPGEAALALVGNAVAARTRPAEVMAASAAAARGALHLCGPRGDAATFAHGIARSCG